MDDDLLAAVAGAREALGDTGRTIGDVVGGRPRFELFHAANSICSQKVRAVLAHHRLPYVSHELNLFVGQTYLPGYVRLRMRGCDDYGGALVDRHSGSTSAAAYGCDGAVVPTLVDWDGSEVVVDSRRICLHVDATTADADRLRPDTLAAAIDADLEVVDHMPNYQMLMGRSVGTGAAADDLHDVGASFSQRKVAWCSAYLASHGDDPRLAAAYTAKRAKELSAATELFSPAAMTAAYARAAAGLGVLEVGLARRTTAWLHGDRPTMADLFWGIELSRMANVGCAHFWEGGRLPQVERFAAATAALPAIRAAVTEWPGAMF